MNCPDCSQPVEASATFCGNCGRQIRETPVANKQQNYALANPKRRSGETKAMLAVLFGISGMVGGLFVAIVGLTLGITGLVMGTMSHSSKANRRLSTVGILASSLAVLVGLGVWSYAIKRNMNQDQQITSAQTAKPTASGAGASTPCYSIGFVDELNISNTQPSCDLNAYNGTSLNNSTNAYKIYANKSQVRTVSAFNTIVSKAIEKDLKTSLPGFTIDSQQAATFAGSPAYIATATNANQTISVVEAAVMHPVSNGENVFILVHATNSPKTDLNVLEAQWQWK